MPNKRMDDNSIKKPTFIEADGHRFTFITNNEKPLLEWCLLSGKINKKAYIILTDFGHPVYQLFGAECDLTLSPVWARIYFTYEAARRDIAMAISKCKKANPQGNTELFENLEIIEINVARDELKHKFMRKEIAMHRRNKK